jgi:hypothetical protein
MRQFSSSALSAFLLLGPAGAMWADQRSDVEALESQCEQQREAMIKPLRDIEIEKCKTIAHNDADYCVRYWKDYGNAVRLANGNMSGRMFDDLPVCVQAFEARKALINRADK